jgi:predicted SAM-dependent methyltransferase
MYEASKAIRRRYKADNDRYFTGEGVDIGAGPDCISQHGYDAYNWDLKDGDAQYMKAAKDNQYSFVHSSHCLEHMKDPHIALRNWIRICKPGGYIVVTIPDEEMYEHNAWPSRFNSDHKWSFRMERTPTKHTIAVLSMLKNVGELVDVISVLRLEAGYDHNNFNDQTMPIDGPECAIEFILRKR